MATPPLRAVLVGCGGISGAWLPPILAHPDLALAALVDLHPEIARKRAREHGLADIPIETDLPRALERHAPVDIVFDLTIPAAHHAVTTTALRHGCHVLGEKPLADTLANARAMVAAATHAGRLYAITQTRRYDLGARRLRAFLETGALGRITTACCDFFLAAHFGGFREQMEHVLLVDMAIHHFDLARFFLGGARAQRVACQEWNPPGSWYAHGAAAAATFEMEGGAAFLYRGSWCAEGLATSWQGAWRIVGERGSVVWDGGTGFEARVLDGDQGFQRPVRAVEVPAADFPTQSAAHASVIAEFVAAVRAGTVPETVCTDNVHSLAMVFGAVESVECNTRVAIPPS